MIKVSAEADLLQIAMLEVNPATTKFILDHYVDLKPGDWVFQNAANSAVSRYLIQLARARGVHTLNIIRREGLEKELSEIGADLVMVEGEDLPEIVRAELGDANIPLAIDAVAGKATLTLGGILSEEGTVVNYGLLSEEPCQLNADIVVFKGITLTGFLLAKTLGGMSVDAKATALRRIGGVCGLRTNFDPS
ncbi:MAG: zinc-binding dehydrogenase [SAR324 cluster bacterium]|nr:zinc-binding dehydrogenase [SAR324 cluster bacterium]